MPGHLKGLSSGDGLRKRTVGSSMRPYISGRLKAMRKLQNYSENYGSMKIRSAVYNQIGLGVLPRNGGLKIKNYHNIFYHFNSLHNSISMIGRQD